jgi:hypothetical protein
METELRLVPYMFSMLPCLILGSAGIAVCIICFKRKGAWACLAVPFVIYQLLWSSWGMLRSDLLFNNIDLRESSFWFALLYNLFSVCFYTVATLMLLALFLIKDKPKVSSINQEIPAQPPVPTKQPTEP